MNLVARTISQIERALAAPFDAEAMLMFRRYFIFKTWLWTFLIGDVSLMFSDAERASSALIVTVGAALGCRRRGYQIGVFILLLFWTYKKIYLFFPRTANHDFLEILMFLSFWLFPERPIPGSDGKMLAGVGPRVIAFTIVLVVFWTGVQKLAHGRWHNGEAIAFFTLFDGGNLEYVFGAGLQLGNSFFSEPVGTTPFTWSSTYGPSHFALPDWAIGYFVILGVLGSLSEILFPVLICFERTRTIGKIGVVACVAAFSLMAGIFGFTFTGLACCLLLFPNHARQLFKYLFGLLIVFFIIMQFVSLPFYWR